MMNPRVLLWHLASIVLFGLGIVLMDQPVFKSIFIGILFIVAFDIQRSAMELNKKNAYISKKEVNKK